jgi:hypothetical protein
VTTDPSHGAVPAPAALELQDQLLCASTELDRLQRLLADAAQTLLQRFGQTDAPLRALAASASGDAATAAHEALQQLARATQALQFQDMASQLLAYTQQRITHCADRLAAIALDDGDDTDAGVVQPAPDRPNPVVQDEMDSGLIELF